MGWNRGFSHFLDEMVRNQDGNPATHISDIRRVKTVVRDGVVFQVADLDRALGVIPVH